jgi:hypothetical protein
MREQSLSEGEVENWEKRNVGENSRKEKSCEKKKKPVIPGRVLTNQSLNIIIYYYYYLLLLLLFRSTTLCCALAAFSVFWSCTQSVGLFGRYMSPTPGLYLHTGQKKNIKMHRNIHASIGIRTLDCLSCRSCVCTCAVCPLTQAAASYVADQAVGVVLRIHVCNIRSTHEEALRDPLVGKAVTTRLITQQHATIFEQAVLSCPHNVAMYCTNRRKL